LDGVLAALAQVSSETKILAGGQSLVPLMNLGRRSAADAQAATHRGEAVPYPSRFLSLLGKNPGKAEGVAEN